MYVFMLDGPNDNRQCAGVHELNPLHQAEVGGSPTLRLIRFIFRSTSADAAAVIFPCFLVRVLEPMPPPGFINNRRSKGSSLGFLKIKMRSGISPTDASAIHM